MRSLKVGDVVLIKGRWSRGATRCTHYLMQHDPPVDLHGAVLYHCGPVIAQGG